MKKIERNEEEMGWGEDESDKADLAWMDERDGARDVDLGDTWYE